MDYHPRLRWLWGWTYDYDEMISDLREIWPDVEENTVLLHMILSHMLVEADLSDHEVELDIAWEEGKVKVIIALGVVYTNGDQFRDANPFRAASRPRKTSMWCEKFWARRNSRSGICTARLRSTTRWSRSWIGPSWQSTARTVSTIANYCRVVQSVHC
jgi:hypothetical protein